MPHDPNQPLPADVQAMLLKLRKGAAASLDGKKLAAIFACMDGWTLEKVTVTKPSDGGWLIKDIPGHTFHRRYRNSPDGRIHFTATVLNGPGAEWYETTGRAEDEAKIKMLTEAVLPALTALAKQAKPNAKMAVREPRLERRDEEPRHTLVDVSFEFLVRMNAQRITAPDGQVFEVFGDYKNGAIGAQTFQNFYSWAVENTDFMDQVLGLLRMEPVEKKDDPKARYVPPPTADKETLRVWEMLTAMTDGVREEQTRETIGQMTREIHEFHDALKAGDKVLAKRLSDRGFIPIIWGRVYDTNRRALIGGWEEEVNEVSAELVEGMQNMFVRKNTLKLAPILSAKAKTAECVERAAVSVNAHRGVLTGMMRFRFADGSSFKVDNSVVLSYSVHGRPFYRFPTTFHDVCLPGGVKMGYPCEERMNEVFVPAQPPAAASAAPTPADEAPADETVSGGPGPR